MTRARLRRSNQTPILWSAAYVVKSGLEEDTATIIHLPFGNVDGVILVAQVEQCALAPVASDRKHLRPAVVGLLLRRGDGRAARDRDNDGHEGDRPQRPPGRRVSGERTRAQRRRRFRVTRLHGVDNDDDDDNGVV